MTDKRWTEDDGVISFILTSEGLSGQDWIERLEGAGYRLTRYAKGLLRSSDFVPIGKGTVHEVRVLRGSLWNGTDRTTATVRAKAKHQGFAVPNLEVACLIRLAFSDGDLEAMGLWWVVVMHEPVRDSDGDPKLLGVSRNGDGRWLNAYYVHSGNRWDREDAFAFVVA